MTHAAVVLEPALTVTVWAGRRRLDVDLPGQVPLADWLPSLADRLGVIDAAALAGAYLASVDGEVLDPALGLSEQGVGPGAVLTLVVGRPQPPLLYDDPADAISECVDPPQPSSAVVAGVSWGAVVGCLVFGWCSLLVQPRAVAMTSAAAVALVLVAGSAILASTPVGALVLAWTACVFAGLAGALIDDHAGWLGCGLALSATGLVATAALDRLRRWLLPPVAIGAAVTACGAAPVVGLPEAVVPAAAIVIVTALPALLPKLAVLALDPGEQPVDELAARAWARRSRELVDALFVAICCGSSLIGLVLAGDLMGAAATASAALLLVLEAGDSDVRRLAAALAGAVMVGAAAWTAQQQLPSGRWLVPAAAAVATLTSVVMTVRPPRPSPARTRWRERTRAGLLVALPVLAVLASGVLR